MTEADFQGQLTGSEGSAICRVRIDVDGAPYIQDVAPPLPEGEYRLAVNELTFDVCHFKDHWVQSSVRDENKSRLSELLNWIFDRKEQIKDNDAKGLEERHALAKENDRLLGEWERLVGEPLDEKWTSPL